MAKTATKKEATVAEKLESLYKLQQIDSEIDGIRILRGELPLEVEDLEDEVEGLNTRISRMEEIKNTGADMMITSCPKCVSHFECLKFEDEEKYDIEILDVVSFLARQVEAKKSLIDETATSNVSVEA